MADGIGGTGIVQGRLTNFGSVYVNGIHFNTDNASFTRDGTTGAQQSDFNIGEIVKVVGTVNADRKTGTASEVIYTDVLEGPVTRVADGGTLIVMEQTVITDPLTVLHGFQRLSDLQLGNIVEISGYSSTEGEIVASSIRLVSDEYTEGSRLEVEGIISEHNIAAQTFRINDLTINYSQALLNGLTHADLYDGQYLTAATEQPLNGSQMSASELTWVEDTLEPGYFYEIEGLITDFISSANFELEGIPVTTDANTLYSNGSVNNLAADEFILAYGMVNDQGILVAEEITILDYTSEVHLEATLEAVDTSAKTITILGQTLQVDAYTLLSDETTEDFVELQLNQFVIGEPVYVVAYQHVNGHYIASRLSRVSSTEGIYVSAIPTNVDTTQNTMDLFGNTIITDGNTLFLDSDLNELDQNTFYQLADGDEYITMFATLVSNATLLAETLILESE